MSAMGARSFPIGEMVVIFMVLSVGTLTGLYSGWVLNLNVAGFECSPFKILLR